MATHRVEHFCNLCNTSFRVPLFKAELIQCDRPPLLLSPDLSRASMARRTSAQRRLRLPMPYHQGSPDTPSPRGGPRIVIPAPILTCDRALLIGGGLNQACINGKAFATDPCRGLGLRSVTGARTAISMRIQRTRKSQLITNDLDYDPNIRRRRTRALPER